MVTDDQKISLLGSIAPAILALGGVLIGALIAGSISIYQIRVERSIKDSEMRNAKYAELLVSARAYGQLAAPGKLCTPEVALPEIAGAADRVQVAVVEARLATESEAIRELALDISRMVDQIENQVDILRADPERGCKTTSGFDETEFAESITELVATVEQELEAPSGRP